MFCNLYSMGNVLILLRRRLQVGLRLFSGIRLAIRTSSGLLFLLVREFGRSSLFMLQECSSVSRMIMLTMVASFRFLTRIAHHSIGESKDSSQPIDLKI